MSFLLGISFLSETHWVPNAPPSCLLQGPTYRYRDQVLKWGTSGGDSLGTAVAVSVTPRGAWTSKHRRVDSCLSWGLGAIFREVTLHAHPR